MKTKRMARNTDNRNAHKEMAVRGRASLARSSVLDREVPLTGRRFRRANKLTRAEAALLNLLIARPDGSPIMPTVKVEMDERTRMITGWHVS